MPYHSPTSIPSAILHEQSQAAVARMRELGVKLNEPAWSTDMPRIEYRDLTKQPGEAFDLAAFAGRVSPGNGILAAAESPFHADGTHLTVVRWGKGEDQCGRIEVDKSVTLSECAIVSYKSVKVGAGVLFGPGVVVMDCDGAPIDMSKPATPDNLEMAPVVIEDGCWLGAYAIVMPGVTIGHHSTIAGGSVVFKDVPPHSVAAGNPASVLARFRDDNGNPIEAGTPQKTATE